MSEGWEAFLGAAEFFGGPSKLSHRTSWDNN